MTLVVIATCYDTTEKPYKPYAIAACDAMLSEDYTSRTGPIQKIQRVGFFGNWLIGHAGRTSRFLPLRDTLTKARAEIERANGEVDWPDLLQRAYHKQRDESICATYLQQYGYASVADFVESGLQRFGESEFGRICGLIESYDLQIGFIIAGFDAYNRVQILGIDHPGEAAEYAMLGHVAIGSGGWLATGWLNWCYQTQAPLKECMYRVLEAKFFSERAPGVGLETVIVAMDSQGQMTSIGKENIDDLRQAWQGPMTKPPDDLDGKLDLYTAQGF